MNPLDSIDVPERSVCCGGRLQLHSSRQRQAPWFDYVAHEKATVVVHRFCCRDCPDGGEIVVGGDRVVARRGPAIRKPMAADGGGIEPPALAVCPDCGAEVPTLDDEQCAECIDAEKGNWSDT